MFPRVIAPASIPTSNVWMIWFPCILTKFSVTTFFLLQLSWLRCHAITLRFRIFLTSNQVEHLFICHLNILFCEMFSCFLILFLNRWIFRALFIFCMKVICQICDFLVVPPNIHLVLPSSSHGILQIKGFSFDEVQLIFSFCGSCLWCCLRILCLLLYIKDFLSVF